MPAAMRSALNILLAMILVAALVTVPLVITEVHFKNPAWNILLACAYLGVFVAMGFRQILPMLKGKERWASTSEEGWGCFLLLLIFVGGPLAEVCFWLAPPFGIVVAALLVFVAGYSLARTLQNV